MDKRWQSGTIWEQKIGYSRAVRRGNRVVVSGTTAMDGEVLIGEGNAGEQAAFIFAKIAGSLRHVDAQLNDVINVRMYITQPTDATAVTEAFAATFAQVQPCATLVIVKGLIDPQLLVEIEVEAEVLPA